MKKTRTLKASFGGSNTLAVLAQPFSNSNRLEYVQDFQVRSAPPAPHIFSVRKEVFKRPICCHGADSSIQVMPLESEPTETDPISRTD